MQDNTNRLNEESKYINQIVKNIVSNQSMSFLKINKLAHHENKSITQYVFQHNHQSKR